MQRLTTETQRRAASQKLTVDSKIEFHSWRLAALEQRSGRPAALRRRPSLRARLIASVPPAAKAVGRGQAALLSRAPSSRP